MQVQCAMPHTPATMAHRAILPATTIAIDISSALATPTLIDMAANHVHVTFINITPVDPVAVDPVQQACSSGGFGQLVATNFVFFFVSF